MEKKYGILTLVVLTGCMSTTQKRQTLAPLGPNDEFVAIGTENTTGVTDADGITTMRDADTRQLLAHGQVKMMSGYGRMYDNYMKQVSNMYAGPKSDPVLAKKVAGMEKNLDTIAAGILASDSGKAEPAGASAAAASNDESEASGQMGMSPGQLEYLRADISSVTTVDGLAKLVDGLIAFTRDDDDKRFLVLVKKSVDAANTKEMKLQPAEQAKRVQEIKKGLLRALEPTTSTKAPVSSTTGVAPAAPAAPVSNEDAAERFDRELNAAQSFKELAAAFENAKRNVPEASQYKFADQVTLCNGYAKLSADEQAEQFVSMKQSFVGASTAYRSLITK